MNTIQLGIEGMTCARCAQLFTVKVAAGEELTPRALDWYQFC